MLLLKIYFWLMPLTVGSIASSNNDIVIIGEAFNQKDGAWIDSKKKGFYFIEGIDSWDEKIVGKKVKVWGRLVITKITHETQGKSPAPGIPPPPPRQEPQGVDFIKTILKAKWELAK